MSEASSSKPKSASQLKRLAALKARKAARKARDAGKTPRGMKEKKERRVKASELRWRSVPTHHLADAGGMVGLEEVEGVRVEWEEVEGGRRARFVTTAASDDEKEDAAEDGDAGAMDVDEEAAEDDEEDEEDADALPDFTALATEDMDAEDEDAVVDPEPEFDDSKLKAWSPIPLHNALRQGLLKLGFKKPTEIQAAALPQAMEGEDVVGVAETGSGKTLAYGLPILSHLLRQPRPSGKRTLSALVLCPTRELALQVADALSRVIAASLDEDFDPSEGKSKGKGKAAKAGPPRISVGAVVGGLSLQRQQRIVQRGADILVATPGRLWDILQADTNLAAEVRALRFLVIDEADRMVETGHFAELERIVRLTQRADEGEEEDDPTFARAATALSKAHAKDDMQTFVFSATLSKALQANLKKRRRPKKGKATSTLDDLMDRLDFRHEPQVVDLSPEGGLVASLREAQVSCVVADKDLYLYYFLLRYPGRTLVFTSSIDGIRRLVPLFDTLKVPVYPLHSQLQQKQRLKNLDRFRNSPNATLIATDVAARGLDIPHVDHVVHFNLPRTADAYVHRSGRTARAQNSGFALQLVAPDDRGVQRGLLKALGRTEAPEELDVEAGFLRQLKERINVARDIEKAMHKSKKQNHERNWLLEAAEALDVDVDENLLSDAEDADAPSVKKQDAALIPLKNKLANLLAQPLLARGISARYPTSGSRVIVDEVLRGAHGALLGASTASAVDVIDEVAVRRSKEGPKKKPAPKPKVKKEEGHRKRKGEDAGRGGKKARV